MCQESVARGAETRFPSLPMSRGLLSREMSGPAIPRVQFFQRMETGWKDAESRRGQESSEGNRGGSLMKWKKKEKKERKEGEGDVIKSKWRKGECNEWGESVSREGGNRFILRSIYLSPPSSYPKEH